MKQWLTSLIKLTVASGLIYWLVSSDRLSLDGLAQLNHPLIWAGGFLLFLGTLLVNSRRWQLLLAFEDVQVTFWRTLQLSLIGLFFNFFVPGGVGGDVVKGSYLIRENRSKAWFIGWSILVDRLFGVIALLTYSSVAGIFYSDKLPKALQSSFYTLSVFIFVSLLSGILLLIFLPKQRTERFLSRHRILEKVALPLFYFVHQPKRVILPFLLSLVGQGSMIAIGFFLVRFLNVPLDLWVLLLIFPFGFLATVLPISPAGIGVGQAAFYYLFDKVASQGEFGVLVVTFLQVVQFLVGLIGGGIFILQKKQIDGQ